MNYKSDLSPSIAPTINLNEYMDVEFFEKCFFGKKLHPKD